MPPTLRRRQIKPTQMVGELPLPKIPATVGLDPSYWKRYLIWINLATGSVRNQVHDSNMTELQKRGYRQVCAFCHTQVIDNKLTCPCFVHAPCLQWGDQRYGIDRNTGACKKQIHCRHCCTCLVCVSCFKIIERNKNKIDGDRTTPKNYDPFCRRCSACCVCKICINCDSKVVPPGCACSDKNKPHHAACCDSDAQIKAIGPNPLMLKRAPLFHAGTNFQHNRCRRFLAVETELLNYAQCSGFVEFNKIMRQWHCATVPEGTVPQGFEINAAPASGNLFNEEIAAIVRGVKAIKGNTGIRCGTHVHVDARDFTYTDLVNLIYLYKHIEPALFAMLPPWRRISRFTVPCANRLMQVANNGFKLVETTKDHEMACLYPKLGTQTKKKTSIALRLAENFYGTQTLYKVKKIHKNHSNQALRYMALNLHSWVFRRTIEFRHWPGSLDVEEMTLWPQICGTLLDTAKRMPISTTRNKFVVLPTIKDLPDHPVEALLQILKPSSKVSSELHAFAAKTIQKWSPDFDTWWPICQINKDIVVPFKLTSHDGLVLSFDTVNSVYTYIASPFHGNWDYEWGHPSNCKGRYAEKTDLHAIPTKGKLLWMIPAAKKQTQITRKEQTDRPQSLEELLEEE